MTPARSDQRGAGDPPGEDRLQQLFEHSRDGFVVIDGDGRFLDANPAYCRMLGYTLEELKAKPDFYNITPPQWHRWEREEIWVKRLLGKGYSGLYEKEYVRKDGSVFPVELQSYAVRDSRGNISYLWGIARDITEERAREERLRESEERGRLILRHAGVGIAYWDAGGRLVQMNDLAAGYLGGRPEEFTGKTLQALFPGEAGATYDRRIADTLSQGASREFEDLVELPGGRKWFLSTFSAITGTGGETLGVLIVSRDITLRKRLEEEQRKYAEEMEEEVRRTRQYAELIAGASDAGGVLIGEGPKFKRVLEFVASAGPADSPVLVLGESGTGKEVVARAIHAGGHRAPRPFVVVDCAALKGGLLESELFGHVKGAFTGAHQEKPGLVEVAAGGTLFVDEIGEMPLELQSKLLRVLERGEYRRLGDVEEKATDIRVIAATNRDLAREVKAGSFREDLYYRLNVLSITLPPLRRRPEDIPLLATHFLEHTRVTVPVRKRISARAMEKLQAYAWPGNVRELSNVIERAVILSGAGKLIDAKHLPREIRRHKASETDSLQVRSLAEAEKETIEIALAATGGNKTRAAAILGIARITLREKMKKYGLK